MTVGYQHFLMGLGNGYSVGLTLDAPKSTDSPDHLTSYATAFDRISQLWHLASACFACTNFMAHPTKRVFVKVASFMAIALFQLPILLATAVRKGDYKNFAQVPQIQKIAESVEALDLVFDFDDILPNLSQKSIEPIEKIASYLPKMAFVAKLVEIIAYAALGSYLYAATSLIGLAINYLDAKQLLPAKVSHLAKAVIMPLAEIACLLDPASFIFLRAYSACSLAYRTVEWIQQRLQAGDSTSQSAAVLPVVVS